MPEFPASPIPPKEFLESWLPKAIAEVGLPENAKSVDVKLGIRLEGDGGGDWLYHIAGGAVTVTPASTEEAAFTLIQSVEDWRGALWGGRGGAFGKQASGLFKPGAQGQAPAGPGGRPMDPAALGRLQALSGMIRMVVAGGPGGDWKTSFKLGPGPIPAEPTTTVTISHDDASAMERGELDPMQAFMAGRIQIAGDMALMMQMQAATM